MCIVNSNYSKLYLYNTGHMCHYANCIHSLIPLSPTHVHTLYTLCHIVPHHPVQRGMVAMAADYSKCVILLLLGASHDDILAVFVCH